MARNFGDFLGGIIYRILGGHGYLYYHYIVIFFFQFCQQLYIYHIFMPTERNRKYKKRRTLRKNKPRTQKYRKNRGGGGCHSKTGTTMEPRNSKRPCKVTPTSKKFMSATEENMEILAQRTSPTAAEAIGREYAIQAEKDVASYTPMTTSPGSSQNEGFP